MCAALSAVSGCAGDGPPPGSAGSTFDVIQQTIFNPNCLGGGCHNTTDRANNLVLEPGQSFDNLVNVLSFDAAARAAGLLRVAPGNPDASFLFIKVTGPTPGQGTRMPQGAAPLSSDDIALIQEWILAGAPPPGTPTPSAPPTAPATATATPSAGTATPTRTEVRPPTESPTATPTGSRAPSLTATPTLTPRPSASASPTSTPPVAATPTFSVDATFPQIQATIFDTTCLDVGCHNSVSMAGGQVLEPDTAYANLVGAVPQNAAAAAAGFLRVDPGNPDSSFLITKLTLPSAFDPEFFSRMPLGKPMLAPEQIENIRAWILRGALPDESP